MQLDLTNAKANIAAALEEARAHVARLETTQSLIESQGEGVIDLVTVISQYSRKKREAAPRVALAENARMSDVVRAILAQATTPLRAEQIMALPLAQPYALTRKQTGAILDRLRRTGEVVRLGRGLYARPAGAKGNGIVDTIVQSATPKPHGAKATKLALIAAVEAHAATFGKEPFRLDDLLAKIEASGFPFYGTQHTKAVQAAVAALGKKIRKTGHARMTRYQWRG